jgi:cell wall-associated NlpC family hydrolase
LKKVAILGAVVVLLGCSAATVADDHKSSSIIEYKPVYKVNQMSQIVERHKEQTMLEQQAAEALRLKIEAAEANRAKLVNEQALKDRVAELQKHVGKTWYVFSGSSPRGWDCSGMTRWFYEGLGIEIEHSASKQGKYAGYHVETPKLGDIVAFSHLNSEKYYHVGIYVGNNKIIHAGFRKGTKTEKISLDSPAFKNSEISFVRVIEN